MIDIFSNTFAILAVYWMILLFLLSVFYIIAYVWILPVLAVFIHKYLTKRDFLHPNLLLAAVSITWLTSSISFLLRLLGRPDYPVQSRFQSIPNGIFAFGENVFSISSQIFLLVLLLRLAYLLYMKTGLKLSRAVVVLVVCCIFGIYFASVRYISSLLSLCTFTTTAGFLIYIVFSPMDTLIGRIHIFASLLFFTCATCLIATFAIFRSLENNYDSCIGITCKIGQKNIAFINNKLNTDNLYNNHKHPVSNACSNWLVDEKLLPYTFDQHLRHAFDFSEMMTCLRGKTPSDFAVLLVQNESSESRSTKHAVMWFPFGYQPTYSMQTTPIYTTDLNRIEGQLQMNNTMVHYHPEISTTVPNAVPRVLLFTSHQDLDIRTEVRVISTVTLDREPFMSLFLRSYSPNPNAAFLASLRPLLESDSQVQTAVLAQRRILDGIVLKPLELDGSSVPQFLAGYTSSPHAECEVAREPQHCITAHEFRPPKYSSFLPSGIHWKLRHPTDVWIMGQNEAYLFDLAQDTIIHKSSNGESGGNHFEEVVNPYLKTPNGDRMFKFDISGSHGSQTYYVIVYADETNPDVYAVPNTYRLRCDLETYRNKSCSDLVASISPRLFDQDLILDSYFATQFPDFLSLLSASL